MAVDLTQHGTRRSFLATLAGGAAGAIAATIAGAERVLAAGDDGKALVIGGSFTDARSTTNLWTNSSSAPNVSALDCRSDGEVGLFGESRTKYGVYGNSQRGTGVYGRTFALGGFGVDGAGPGVGIKGASSSTDATNGTGVGVFGTSKSPDGAGVDGRSPNVGVRGESDGTGVHGKGTDGGTGVRGQATGGGTGVLGNSATGRAVVGVASDEVAANVGVMGESFSSKGTGVRGWAAGDATGVLGYSGGDVPDPLRRTGVYGVADQATGSVGVRGASKRGRGGVFSGGASQLRLVPSAATTHPASGTLGDLFLDKNARLWFCKGGSSWKQLA